MKINTTAVQIDLMEGQFFVATDILNPVKLIL